MDIIQQFFMPIGLFGFAEEIGRNILQGLPSILGLLFGLIMTMFVVRLILKVL